jgi:hypothetical protein
MQKIIAILVLEGEFDAAIETPSGFEHRSFPNTGDGVESFSEFAATFVRLHGPNYKFCITAPSVENYGEIGDELLANGYGPASLSPYAFNSYAERTSLPKDSAVTLAQACIDKFPSIRTLAL